MRLTKSFEKHRLFKKNAGLEGRKGACRVRIEQRGISGGAKYEVRVGTRVEARGSADSTRKARALVAKLIKGC